jgi:HPr kinase/phosphorylase
VSARSELALELISRGHGLVADDVVEMGRLAPATLEGRCPGMLRDFPRSARAWPAQHPHHIRRDRLPAQDEAQAHRASAEGRQAGADAPRLPLDAQTQEVLGVPVRKVLIPVAAGRNLAVLLEAAVRNTILQLRGIDSMQEFVTRQQRALLDDDI